MDVDVGISAKFRLNRIGVSSEFEQPAFHFFYPRDAILARYYGPVSVCATLSECLSVTSAHCIKAAEQIELMLAERLPSTYFYPTMCYKETQQTPEMNFTPNPRLRQFRHGTSIVTACLTCLNSTKADV